MRKVCVDMPKQCYSLIALVLCISSLCSQVSFWTHSEGAAVFAEKEQTGFSVSNKMGLEYRPADLLKLSLENDLFGSDQRRGNQAQELIDSGKAKLLLTHRNSSLELGYRYNAYQDSQSFAMFPLWQGLYEFDRQDQHWGSIGLQQKVGFASLSANAMVKSLTMDTMGSEFDWESGEFVQIALPQTMMRDNYAQAAILLSPIYKFAIQASCMIKENDLPGAKLYDYTHTDLEMSYADSYENGLHIQSGIAWQYRDASWVQSEAVNRYRLQMRIHKQLVYNLHGYLSYSNQTCSDTQLSELLLISNNLRGQLKYNLQYDPSSGSFVSIGAKYSPENEESAVFSETDLKLYNKIYFGTEVNWHPDRQIVYTGKLSYYFGGYDSLYLYSRQTKNSIDDWEYSYLGLGISLFSR